MNPGGAKSILLFISLSVLFTISSNSRGGRGGQGSKAKAPLAPLSNEASVYVLNIDGPNSVEQIFFAARLNIYSLNICLL